MTQAFISYRREKTKIVESLVEDINSMPGHSAFIDTHQLEDKEWWQKILDGIEKTDVFIPIYDDTYDESYICCRELDFAIALNKPLIPTLVDSIDSSKFTPRQANRWDYLSYNSKDRDVVIELLNRLTHVNTDIQNIKPKPVRPGYPNSAVLEVWDSIIAGENKDAHSQIILIDKLSELRDDVLTHSDLDFLLSKFNDRTALFARPVELISKLRENSGKLAKSEEKKTDNTPVIISTPLNDQLPTSDTEKNEPSDGISSINDTDKNTVYEASNNSSNLKNDNLEKSDQKDSKSPWLRPKNLLPLLLSVLLPALLVFTISNKSYNDLSKDVNNLEKELENKRRDINSLKDDLNTSNQKIKYLNRQIETDSKTHSELKYDYQEDISSLNVQISLLSDINKDYEQQLSESQSSAAEQTEIAEELARQLSEINLKPETAVKRQNERKLEELAKKLESSLETNGIKDPLITIQQDSVSFTIQSESLFNSKRARLSGQGRSLMDQVSNALRDFSNNPIRIEGHTDGIPVSGSLQQIFPSNWELSVARAANAVNYMLSLGGFDPSGLSVSGFGEFRPLAPNDTQEGRALNRRIEIVIDPE